LPLEVRSKTEPACTQTATKNDPHTVEKISDPYTVEKLLSCPPHKHCDREKQGSKNANIGMSTPVLAVNYRALCLGK